MSKPATIRLARAVLLLAVATVLFAGLLALPIQQRSLPPWLDPGDVRMLAKIAITILPLAAAVLLGLIERRSRTGSWIERRAAAESLLREIYRARAGAGVYADTSNRWKILSESVSRIDARLAGRVPARDDCQFDDTWTPPTLRERIPAADTLLGPLTASNYDAARVRHQLGFMDHSIRANERRATGLTVALFIVSAATATLFAVSWRWGDATSAAAVVASFAAALISWREYLHLDATNDFLRQTAVEVRNIRGNWQAFAASERDADAQLSSYVGSVEDALAAEGSNWERSLKQAHDGFTNRQRGR